MAKRYRRSRTKRRRSKISASNAGPILAFLATIFGVLAVIGLVVFVALPQLLPLVGVDFALPWQPTPTPQPTSRPTPTPHPVIAADPAELQHEVVLSTEYSNYRWVADPYAYGDRLLFVAGLLVENDVHMDALFSLDMRTNVVEEISAKREYQDYLFPVCNDTWLVYLDGKNGGGGALRAMNWQTGDTLLIKDVYTGQPKPHLDGNYVAWMERTGSYMDKLFVTDLTTMENTAIELFSNTSYGQSDISMSNGELIYAYEGEDVDESTQGSTDTSGIYRVSFQDANIETYYPNTYVYDPQTNGTHWVWRDGLYGEGNSLYYTKGMTAPRRLAENIIDYGISKTFVAYSKHDEPIKIFLFDLEREISITPDIDREKVQLLGVSNGVVIWMDVTSRDRDIMKYAKVE